MTPELFKCLTEERSIFRIFDSSQAIGDFEAFHSPRREAIAHWNLTYPAKANKPNPTPDELSALLKFYQTLDIEGYLATTDRRTRDIAAEECEYFRLEGAPRVDRDVKVENYRHRPEDLRLFASVIQGCFILSDESKDAFLTKMEKLREHDGSRFYVIESKEGRIIGCANTIRTESGADFLFNVGALPDFNDLTYFDSIVAYVATRSTRPLYTYHRSPVMRNNVLRSTGFTPIGVLYCVPLKSLVNDTE